jgi:hypothetical protein
MTGDYLLLIVQFVDQIRYDQCIVCSLLIKCGMISVLCAVC